MNTKNRLAMLGMVMTCGVTACAGADGQDDDAGPTSAAPVPVTEPSTVPADATGTSTSTSTSATTTTTRAPTTTLAPTDGVIDDVCESLRVDGFETRRATVDTLADAIAAVGGEGDGRAEVAAECGDELEQLDAAVAIRDRVVALESTGADGSGDMVLTDFVCEPGTFEVTVTNTSDTALGLHLHFEISLEGVEDQVFGSSVAPLVVWSLEPSESQTIGGQFVDVAHPDARCDIRSRPFDADSSSAGAPLSSAPERPALTGDDPSVWFPALWQLEEEARASGDTDLVATLHDVRSPDYDDVLAEIVEGDERMGSEIVEVCERGRSQPDPDRISFVYRQEFENGGVWLRHGLFRRGADGQWRWLAGPRFYASPIGPDCSVVDMEL